MWFFKKKETFGSTGFFKGWTDYHCHILPGVDDGFQNMENSLAALHRYEELGIREVWLTPHTMEDMPNTTESLKRHFAELQSAYNSDGEGEKVILHLASEYMLDNKFEEHLQDKDFLTIGSLGNQVLVETSYYNPPTNMLDKLIRLKQAGFYPVIAHPERYLYMTDADYKELKGMDAWFQLNLASLGGGYGGEVRHRAEMLLKLGYYNYCGTDLHRLTTIDAILGTPMPKYELAF